MILRRILLPIALLVLTAGLLPAQGQSQQPDVPCYWRPSSLDKPWVGPDIPCLEEVTPAGTGGELTFTALAVAPDGTLYAARPLAGEVWALTDGDGDGLPETPELAANGLTRPNGLAWFDDALYIAAGPEIAMLRAGELRVLVDELPAGGGYWTGGIAVGALDGDQPRIYVGTGAVCDTCETGDTGRGAVWSFALDGSDGRIEATGFRQPADLTFANSFIWVLDSAPASLFDTPNLDEVNRLFVGGDFGFPHCFGADTRPECADTIPPSVVLPTGSTPLGLSGYSGDVIPPLTDSLLLALSGSTGQVELRGYTFAQADPATGALTVLIPQTTDRPGFTATDELNYRTVGFYPARPYDVAVSPLGWVYLSLSNGRILAIRPQPEIVD